jgi:hypothetical protein
MTWFEIFALAWPFVAILFVVTSVVLLNVYGERLERGLHRQHPAE